MSFPTTSCPERVPRLKFAPPHGLLKVVEAPKGAEGSDGRRKSRAAQERRPPDSIVVAWGPSTFGDSKRWARLREWAGASVTRRLVTQGIEDRSLGEDVNGHPMDFPFRLRTEPVPRQVPLRPTQNVIDFCDNSNLVPREARGSSCLAKMVQRLANPVNQVAQTIALHAISYPQRDTALDARAAFMASLKHLISPSATGFASALS